MKFLFIKPKQIGDSLILTPTLVATRQAYPDAEIWILIREGCEGIMAGCPAVDRILTIAPVEQRDRRKNQWRRDAATLMALRKVRFDCIIELGDGHRGRWFSLLCRRRRSYSVRPDTPLHWLWRWFFFTKVSNLDWSRIHRVEKDYLTAREFLPLPLPAPPLMFERAKTVDWPPAAGLEDFAIIHIGTRQKWNRWDRGSWLQVARRLLQSVGHIIISGGPGDREVSDAQWLGEQLGERALCTLGQASWAHLAGLMYRARLVVCPNTAAMHLAAACQCPTVAIFGPSSEIHWRPWQSPNRIVISAHWRPDVDDPHDNEALLTRKMTDVRMEDVLAACDAMLRPVQTEASTPQTT